MFLVTFPDMEGLFCHIPRLCGYNKTYKIQKGCLSLGKIEACTGVPHSKRKKKKHLKTKLHHSIFLQT